MTVRINKPALNLREELTKAQSVVPYVQQQFWMDGLVENGTFDTDTNWLETTAGFWTISGGVATLPYTGTYSALYQPLDIEVGKRYKITFEVSNISGSLKAGFTSQIGMQVVLGGISTNGTKTAIATFTTADSKGFGIARDNAGGGTIDNVKVFEVDENDNVIHSLPLGWKPLHVYEDGLIQREGDVHDYTVVKTGGAYAIKPAVQPTATTETCVIAEREL